MSSDASVASLPLDAVGGEEGWFGICGADFLVRASASSVRLNSNGDRKRDDNAGILLVTTGRARVT